MIYKPCIITLLFPCGYLSPSPRYKSRSHIPHRGACGGAGESVVCLVYYTSRENRTDKESEQLQGIAHRIKQRNKSTENQQAEIKSNKMRNKKLQRDTLIHKRVNAEK